MSDDRYAPLDAEAGACLIEAVGTAVFGPRLLEIAQSISAIDEVFGYIVVDGGEPEPVGSSGSLGGIGERVNLYVRRFYQHDPTLRRIRRAAPSSSFVQRIGLASIVPHDYRQHCFVEPGFCDKLSFGWRGDTYMLVLSFYRRDVSDEAALIKLSSLANLALAAMVRHHAPVVRENIADLLELRLLRSFPLLSRRERQVFARSISGQTAKAIGVDLNMTAGTVITYRQRGYQRYGFSKVSDFLPALLH